MTGVTDESGRFNQQDDALEHALGRLGDDIVFPGTPDLATAFRHHAAERERPRSPRGRRWPLAALAAILVGFLVLAIPGTRSTVAGWLEIAGIRIEIGDDPRTDVPVSLGSDLLLGRPVSLAEAQSAVSFEVLAPASMSPDEPRAYLDPRDGTAVISLVYPASETLPSIGETGAGMLLMLFDPAGDTAVYVKRAADGASTDFLTVDGALGVWIERGALAIPPAGGRPGAERPSGHVLIWELDGITARMETMLTRDESLAIARRLTPIGSPEPEE